MTDSAHEDACHECGGSSTDTCVRCSRATCDACFAEQEHLGLCRCCDTELASSGLPLVDWPHPLRKPFD
jgi:hypothetical protein